MSDPSDSPIRKFSVPLTLLMPLALIVFVTAATWWTFHVGRSQASESVRSEAIRDLTWTASRFESMFERDYRLGEYEAIQADVADLATNREFTFVVLTDENYKVLHSMRVADIGKQLNQVLPAAYKNAPLLQLDNLNLIRERKGGRTEATGDGRTVIAAHPLVLGRRIGELRPNRIGSLILVSDYSATEAAALRVGTRDALSFFTLSSLFAVALGLFFHFAVARRLKRLARAAEYFGSGNTPVDTGVGGSDEVASLARSIDTMMVQKTAANQQRDESEERLRAILESATDAIITIDEHGIIESANLATERLFGYLSSELLGRNVKLLMPSPYSDEHDQYLANYARTGEAKIIGIGRQVVARRKDGSTFPIDLAVSQLTVRDRLLFTGIVRDVSDRQRAEELQTSFGRILEDSLNEIYIFDADDLRFLRANRGALENIGYSMEELRGLTPVDIKPEYSAEEFVEIIEPLKIGARENIVFETVHERKDGSQYDVEVHLQFGRFQSQPCFVAIILDITDRRRAEQDRLESEERYRGLFESTHDLVQSVSPQGDFIFVNPAWKKTLGYGDDDLKQMTMFDIVHPDSMDHCRALFQQVMSGEMVPRVEAVFVAKDGRPVVVEGNATPRVSDGEVVATHGFFRDITDRKKAEESLRVQERALESAVNGILITDPNQTDNPVIYVNAAMEKITGYSAEEVLGRNCRFLQNGDREQEALGELRAAIKEERECKVVLHNYRKDGIPFWNELTVSPVRDENGKLTHFVGIQSDITETIEAAEKLAHMNEELEDRVQQRTQQLENAQEQLVRKEKLATLGQLAGGVAHEIRNPMGVIRNAVYFLQQVQTDDDEDINDALGEISRGLANSERIVSELLDYARGPNTEASLFPLDEALKAALEMVRMPGSIRLERPKPIDARICADRGQIERLLANLIQNAVQAMPDGGTLTLRCDAANSSVVTEVTDTGTGIPDDELEKVFEPLFTHRAKGIGLGLPLCRRYAELNGGSLDVESKLGEGSTFRVTLPLAQNNGA